MAEEHVNDTCCYKKCKNRVEIIYYGKPLCDKHWNQLCEKTPKEAREILGMKEAKNDKLLP